MCKQRHQACQPRFVKLTDHSQNFLFLPVHSLGSQYLNCICIIGSLYKYEICMYFTKSMMLYINTMYMYIIMTHMEAYKYIIYQCAAWVHKATHKTSCFIWSHALIRDQISHILTLKFIGCMRSKKLVHSYTTYLLVTSLNLATILTPFADRVRLWLCQYHCLKFSSQFLFRLWYAHIHDCALRGPFIFQARSIV